MLINLNLIQRRFYTGAPLFLDHGNHRRGHRARAFSYSHWEFVFQVAIHRGLPIASSDSAQYTRVESAESLEKPTPHEISRRSHLFRRLCYHWNSRQG